MALHSDLPIYKAAYDLLGLIVHAVRNMPRDMKPAIGKRMLNEAVKVMTLVFRANVARDKSVYLLKLIERVEVLNLFLRFCVDKRQLSNLSVKQYSAAIALTTSIGKQANGWRKAQSPAT
jgi:hypothetical protein